MVLPGVLSVFAFAVEDPVLFVWAEVLIGGVDVYTDLLGVVFEFALALGSAVGLKGGDASFTDGEGGIGDGFFEIDADDAAKASALGASTDGIIESEESGGGRSDGETGGGIGPSGSEGFFF